MKNQPTGRRLLALLFTLLFAVACAVPALAAGTGLQSDGKQVLTYVNEYRTNPKTAQQLELNWTTTKLDLKPLKWDSDYAHIAEIRAQELSQNYSHYRPNGETYWSCTYNGKEPYTELCARDKDTAKEAVEYWYNPESETYGSQSNRRDMLDSRISRMGAAHYKNSEGRDYWVVVFGK